MIIIGNEDLNNYENLIIINVFLESLKTQKIEQSEKINISEFPLVIFSTIGAFFRISLISLFEILDFFDIWNFFLFNLKLV